MAAPIDVAFANELRALLASGQKIEAVKRYRERTRVGLAEAKRAVENLPPDDDAGSSSAQFGAPHARYAPDSEPTDDEVRALVAAGRKIEAIKRMRELTGLGLAEAKMAVERMVPSAPAVAVQPPPARPAPNVHATQAPPHALNDGPFRTFDAPRPPHRQPTAMRPASHPYEPRVRKGFRHDEPVPGISSDARDVVMAAFAMSVLLVLAGLAAWRFLG